MQKIAYSAIKDELPLEKCREIALLGALSDQAMEFLLSEGVLLDSEEKEELFGVGQRSDRFYLILKGGLEFYKRSNANWAFMYHCKPGEQVGFAGMIVLQPRDGWCYMEADSRVLEVSADLFHQFQEKFPEDFSVFMINIVRDISRTLIQVGNSLVDLSARKKDEVI